MEEHLLSSYSGRFLGIFSAIDRISDIALKAFRGISVTAPTHKDFAETNRIMKQCKSSTIGENSTSCQALGYAAL